MIHNILLAATGITDFWYALPVVVVVSLVYAATRHEATGPILDHAWRTAVWIGGFLAVGFGVLWLIA